MSSFIKTPPKLVDDSAYESWKKDITIWCKFTDIPVEKQALGIHLSLTGRARIATSEIEISDLEKKDGVQIIIEKLDNLFLADKGRRQFAAFHSLYNFRRSSDVDVNKFVMEFEHVYFKFSQQDMTLPDTVMAFMLLAACNLTDSEGQLVMSSITEVSYSNMKSAMKRIFSGDIAPKPSVSTYCAPVKSEPVFYGNDDDETQVMYTRGGFRRGRSSWRGGRGSAPLTGSNRQQVMQRGRKQNPLGPDGKISRCLICESKFHWARDCPDSYEKNNRKEKYSECDDVRINEESIHLALFMGYTNATRNTKLNSLISESKGHAVIDTGCSTTVCGSKWFDNYVCELSDFDRSKVVENISSATFTFGDGVTVRSCKKVTMPCYLSGLRSTITTDVVDCQIPLLLSNCSLKNAKMIIDFGNDTVRVGGKTIDLLSSTSGHYLFPITM